MLFEKEATGTACLKVLGLQTKKGTVAAGKEAFCMERVGAE